MFCVFFFFKQKTAYEMRISDWSSDVCSSDLQGDGHTLRADVTIGANFDDGRGNAVFSVGYQQADPIYQGAREHGRSEEHTSELQSLMRISYAVFCLQKKNN